MVLAFWKQSPGEAGPTLQPDSLFSDLPTTLALHLFWVLWCETTCSPFPRDFSLCSREEGELSGFVGREKGPEEVPSVQCADDQPTPLTSVAHLLSAFRDPRKCHVLSLPSALWVG